jgi:N-acetylmuramoyl-L-alanine amidase
LHLASLPLAGRVIAIDPGHNVGNFNPAHFDEINQTVYVPFAKACDNSGTATNSGYREATFTWRVAHKMRRRLEYLGATVRFTRTANSWDSWGPCIDHRGKFGAKVNANVEISLHADGAASDLHGFTIIRPGLLKGYTGDIYHRSRHMSRYIRRGLIASGFSKANYYGGDGFDTRTDLGTLNMADVPTVMVELGNMRNSHDASVMKRASGRRHYARALCRGIRTWLTR